MNLCLCVLLQLLLSLYFRAASHFHITLCFLTQTQSLGRSDCWMLCLRRIPPNIRDIVYCTGVSLMDEDVWEFIWMKFHSSNAVSEKKILLEALTCSDNIFLLNRFKWFPCFGLGHSLSLIVIYRLKGL